MLYFSPSLFAEISTSLYSVSLNIASRNSYFRFIVSARKISAAGGRIVLRVDIADPLELAISQSSVLGTATRVRTGQSGVRVPVGGRDFLLLQNVQTDSGIYTVSYSVGPGVPSSR